MTLHTKLVSLRKQKGLTQADLAERINVSRQAVSRWEGGYAVPSTDNLKILSELYSVSLDYLLNDNADDFCEKSDVQKQKSQMPEVKAKNKKIHVYFVNAIVLLLAITIVVCLIFFPKQAHEQNEIMPMEDMSTDIIDVNMADTFQLD